MTLPSHSPEILILLEKECEKYPAITSFLENRQMRSGALLSTSGVASLDTEISSNSQFIEEAFSFLDTLSLLDTLYSHSGESLAHCVLKRCVASRSITDIKLVVNTNATSSYTASSQEELFAVLINNPPLAAAVILSILKSIFYK